MLKIRNSVLLRLVVCKIENLLITGKRKLLKYSSFVFRDKQLFTKNSSSNIRIACIAGSPTLRAFESECHIISIKLENEMAWSGTVKPHLLLVDSTWYGTLNKLTRTREEKLLASVITWCHQHNTPTVFWDKEVHTQFPAFLSIAKQFDYIFTADIDSLQPYKTMLPHQNVYLLPNAAQPVQHHPIEENVRLYQCYFDDNDNRSSEHLINCQKIFDGLNQLSNKKNSLSKQHRFVTNGRTANESMRSIKNYRYAVNINTKKQSQSMLSSSIFDYLVSNTLTISNYSRALRLFFGDLVISTDNANELKRRVNGWFADELYTNKIRLAALRKVLQQHTYRKRLERVIKLVYKTKLPEDLPAVLMLGLANSDKELFKLIEYYSNQTYHNKKLLIVATYKSGFMEENSNAHISILNIKQAKAVSLEQLLEYDYLAGLVVTDYYGPNYLTDLILARKYVQFQACGKAEYFMCTDNVIILKNENQQYQYVSKLPLRSAIINKTLIEKEQSVYDWLVALPIQILKSGKLLSIDNFNYCRIDCNNTSTVVDIPRYVNDIYLLNIGLSLEDIYQHSDAILRLPDNRYNALLGKEKIVFPAIELYKLFDTNDNKPITLHYHNDVLQITSLLPDNTHCYLYANKLFEPKELFFEGRHVACLASYADFNLKLVYMYLDKYKKRIGSQITKPNTQADTVLPQNTSFIKLALRVGHSGNTVIKSLIFEPAAIKKGCFINQSDTLIISNHHPTYEALYRYAFVHARVKGYIKANHPCDLFRFNSEYPKGYYEFENVDVYSGHREDLQQIIVENNYRYLCIHLLSKEIWDSIKHYIPQIKIIIWLHGCESAAWYRRMFDYRDEAEKLKAQQADEQRMQLWKEVFSLNHPNLKLVFVSKKSALDTMEDVGINLTSTQYSIIPNYIDNQLFSYRPKPLEQRKKILSIRPYTNHKYANELAVQAILLLAKEPFFNELKFTIIGDGILFEKITAPIKRFSNVTLQKRFLQREEISKLHKEYGIFLCPTRWDAQGVSRDEAMSSGLVPITNEVSAIPEFVDEGCGILAEAEDATGLAAGIKDLYYNPDKFERLSKGAAERVRRQSNFEKTILAELTLCDKFV